ncbi:monoamine oxidase a, putative, partial [Bodo saltans]
YVGPFQERILALIDANQQKLHPMDLSMKSTQYFSGSVKHFTGTIPPLSALALLDVGHVLADLDRLQSTIDPIHPMDSPNASALDQMTVEEYLLQHTVSDDARNAMRVAVRAVLAAEPSEISLLGWCWYVRQSGGIRRILETEGGAQDSKVVGGAGKIAVLAAQRLSVGSVLTNSPIRSVDYSSPDVVSLVTRSGATFYCRRLVLAIAPVQQLRIEYHPPLDANRIMSLQRWPMGHAIKTFVYYKEAFWRKKGLNGTAVCDKGISYVCFEDTKSDGSKPCIMGFVISDMAAKVASLTQAERCEMLTQHYATIFETDEALYPVGYKDKVWAEDPWVGGCYVGTMAPMVLTKYRLAHRDPIDKRIFIAGTESAYTMVGYMDGAVEAGERNARNALVSLGKLGAEFYDVISEPGPSPQLPRNSMELSFWEKHVPNVHAIFATGTYVAAAVVGIVGALTFVRCVPSANRWLIRGQQ